MKNTLHPFLTTMLIAASTLFTQAYGQGQKLSELNYPPNDTHVTFTESNLPIVIITTDAILSRTERALGHMVVINNGSGKINYVDLKEHSDQTIECDLPISIKWRGSTSFGENESRSKKPMSIKTLVAGTTSLENAKKEKVKLLDMGKDNDWVLLAPWQDVSYVRDILTMVMAQGGSTFAPQMRYCEVIFNNIYYGVYILSERATKGKKRLNLWDYGCDADDKPLTEEDNTGDFQVEIDRPYNHYTNEEEPHFTSKYHPVWNNGTEITDKYITYQYKHPEEEDFADLGDAARQAVHTAIDQMEESFRTSTYTSDYPNYIDINSFIDYEIAQEVSNNIDGYRLSTPMWKYSETHAKATGDNAKWKIALWDFNIAYGHNDGYYYFPSRNDWRYTANNIMDDNDSDDEQLIPFYWYKLMNDNAYVQQLKERYTKRRKLNYTNKRVTAICDSLRNLLNLGAVDRDNDAWNNKFLNWSSEIDRVSSFTTNRLKWMDDRWLIASTDPDDPDQPITTGKAEPLTIASGYNMDVICEDRNNINGTVTTGNYAGIDGSGYVFYTYSVRQSGELCKDDGLYSNENANYFVNVADVNALVMKNDLTNEGTLTLDMPAKLHKLYVTGTSADGSSNVKVTVNYSDKTSTSTTFTLPDWSNSTGASVAVKNLGRMAAIANWNGEAGKFSSENKFNIFELAISTDDTKSVSSVSFSRTSGTSTAIFSLSGVYASTDFQLAGTTFWKDNSWNTLCLPFDVEDIKDTPLEGATIKTLEKSEFNDGVLSLTFTEGKLTELNAGVPYIVKWEESVNEDNPTFKDVVVKGEEQPAVTDYVDFIGKYEEITLEGGDYTALYLGANNTLYYPAENHDITIKPYHAYFQLKGSAAGENGSKNIRAINIDYNDDPQGIQTIFAPTNELIDYWYTLDGRRLDEKPTARGIYLHQGRRVMIK